MIQDDFIKNDNEKALYWVRSNFNSEELYRLLAEAIASYNNDKINDWVNSERKFFREEYHNLIT